MVMIQEVATNPRRTNTNVLPRQNGSSFSSMAIEPWPCGLSAATRRYIGSIPSSVRATISSVANGERHQPRAQRWPAGTTGSRSNRPRSGTSPSTTPEAQRAPHSPQGPPVVPDLPSASGSADWAAAFAGAGYRRRSAQLSLSRYSLAPLSVEGITMLRQRHGRAERGMDVRHVGAALPIDLTPRHLLEGYPHFAQPTSRCRRRRTAVRLAACNAVIRRAHANCRLGSDELSVRIFVRGLMATRRRGVCCPAESRSGSFLTLKVSGQLCGLLQWLPTAKPAAADCQAPR